LRDAVLGSDLIESESGLRRDLVTKLIDDALTNASRKKRDSQGESETASREGARGPCFSFSCCLVEARETL
jgi:hypothetical protein